MKPASAISTVAGAVALIAVGVRLDLDPLALARLAILGAALGQLVRYDLREHRIPNRIVLPAAAICAALSLIDGVQLSRLLTGGALLVLLLGVSLARPDALGMGDVKLALLILCALHGAAPRALILAIALYAVLAMFIIAQQGRAAFRIALPLAPFLAAGCALALLT
jgi:leader peptidase (prepilin peptidase) / N-methyltransferase